MPETQPTAETSVRVEPLARWFFRDREIYPDASRDADSAFAEGRKPTSCDRLPVHRSESPTGYSSAGCSPAEPASASPVTVNSSSIAIRRGNQIAAPPHCRDAVQVALVVSAANASVISTLRAGCHFYLAPTKKSRGLGCYGKSLPDVLGAERGLTENRQITRQL